ncbi:MAG: glycosyltransferase family 4 protein, partial [Promethearchaeota archaeon]
MRILQVTPEFPSREHEVRWGGLPNSVFSLSSALARRGHSVEVLAPALPGVPREQEVGGLKVHRVSCLKVLQTPVPTNIFSRMSALGRFDVINAHTPVPVFADLACLSNRHLTGSPFVLTFRTVAIKEKPPLSWASNLYYRTLHRLVTKRTDHFVAISRVLAAWLRSQG